MASAMCTRLNFKVKGSDLSDRVASIFEREKMATRTVTLMQIYRNVKELLTKELRYMGLPSRHLVFKSQQ